MRRLFLIGLLSCFAGATPLGANETLGGDEQLQVASVSAAPEPVPTVRRSRGADARAFELLGEKIPPGSSRQLAWSATELFEGVSVATPVLAVHGATSGPVLCLTAAIHGDELNGIEIVRRVLHALEPSALSGTVVGVPIVNIQAFRRGSRYLPDRRDLNRYFPGSPDGSAASRIAHSLFHNIVRHCDALVDLHTGSFDRANLPQLRADLSHAGVVALARGFGATVIVNSQPRAGTLRSAATRAGIPTVTFEAGGPEQLELEEIAHGVRGIEALLRTLGMLADARPAPTRETIYAGSSWIRADRGGILMSDVELGSEVHKGDLLGRLTDPITNETTAIYSPSAGRVIGMARNQVVRPGFAAYHLGKEHDDENGGLAPPMPDSDVADTSE
jgi:hypothetical protein